MVTRNSKRSKTDIWQNGLIPTVAKPIQTKELINRLLALADHLSALDQSTVTPDKYATVAADLANPKLLNHKNEAVQAHACCAIADILRIYAPDAPYSEEELSRIFRAFFTQLAQAWDTGNSFYPQQSYILTRLVEVRSIILVVDLPDAADLIVLLFDTMYDLAAKGFPQKLEQLAADMLAGVIAEADIIPKKVVSTVFKSLTFTGTSLTANTSNISHPGFTFSVAICETNIDKMSRQVAQLFSEMLDESAKPSGNHTSSAAASFKTLDKIHEWSIQIWKHVPEMLGSIIGLIGDELTSDSEKIRVLATKTIGEILAISEENTSHASIDSNLVHFVTAHKSTWSSWLRKSADVSPTVRSTWVALIPAILNSSSVASEMVIDIRSNVKKCLLDSSEKVRLASCTALESLSFPTFTSRLVDEETLQTLFSLLRERDEDTRTKVIRCLCYLYDNYMKSIMDSEVVDFGSLKATEVKRVENMISKEFPNHFLHLNYINLTSITTAVDVELFENVIPFQNNAGKRCARICHFYTVLDQKSKEAFSALLSRQKKYAHALTKFSDLANDYRSREPGNEEEKENIGQNGDKGSKDDILNKADKIFVWLSNNVPESFNAHACLEKIFLLNNGRHLTLLKNCITSFLDYKTIKNSIKELIVSLNNQKVTKSSGTRITSAEMVSTMKLLLYRAAPILFNKSNIIELMSASKDSLNEFFQISNELLELVASLSPESLQDQVPTMADMLVTDDIYNPKNSVDSLLRSMHHSLKASPQNFPDSLILTDRLLRLAQEGSPVQAKYSAKILGHHQHKEHFLSEIVSSSVPLDTLSSQFSSRLAAIAEVCLIEPLVVEDHVQSINDVITEQVLKKNRQTENSSLKADWISDEDLAENHQSFQILNEKLIVIRYIVNRIRALCLSDNLTNDPGLVKQFEKPIKLLSLIVSTGGEIVKQNSQLIPTPVLYQQRLRLEAGYGILKLARYSALDPLIDHNVLKKIGRLMYDLSLHVREGFMKKLHGNLSSFAIPEKFLYLVFLMGHEPDQKLLTLASTWIKSSYQRFENKQDMAFERALSRLIHGIAHDERYLSYSTNAPDEQGLSSGVLQALEYALKFITMYLSNISKDTNISVLYYIASRVKQYRDATVPTSAYGNGDELIPSLAVHLYRAAELCQLLIKEYADIKNYTLQTWPGKLKLPTDIFCPMENLEEVLAVIGRQYIEDDLQIELRRKIKSIFGRSSTKRSSNKISTPVKKPAKKAKTSRNESKTKSSKAKKRTEAQGRKEREPLRRSARSTKKVTYEEGYEEAGSEEEESHHSSSDYESDY